AFQAVPAWPSAGAPLPGPPPWLLAPRNLPPTGMSGRALLATVVQPHPGQRHVVEDPEEVAMAPGDQFAGLDTVVPDALVAHVGDGDALEAFVAQQLGHAFDLGRLGDGTCGTVHDQDAIRLAAAQLAGNVAEEGQDVGESVDHPLRLDAQHPRVHAT